MAVVGRQEYLATQHRIINDFQEIGKPALWQEKYDINFHKKSLKCNSNCKITLTPQQTDSLERSFKNWNTNHLKMENEADMSRKQIFDLKGAAHIVYHVLLADDVAFVSL